MNNSTRIVVNTAVQYTRTAINLCLSLYSTRLILAALGADDYGIYTLIAGVVSLLSFVVNALVITTQRYISFYTGRGEKEKLKEVFANSLVIHLVLAVAVAVLIEVVGIFLFRGFFNIAPERMQAAYVVFHIVTVMLLVTFITAPFRALLIAHENIVYISIIDVMDGVLKLLAAMMIIHTSADRLILYAVCLCGIQLFNFSAFSIYDKSKYAECVFPRRSLLKRGYVKEISRFAGWTVYSVGCITGRTQGVSILLNKFFSTAVNGAFGIGLQVQGALSFLNSSVMNAMNPQVIKAEGAGGHKKMLRMAEMESKACFLLLSMVAIPCIFEMPLLLDVWLVKVPEHDVFFCRFIVLTAIIDQLTIGLGTANQATGNIKNYSLAVNSIKLFTIVPIAVGFIINRSLLLCMVVYALFEFICAMARLVFLRQSAGLSIRHFAVKVFAREIIPIVAVMLVSYGMTQIPYFRFRFVVTIIAGVVTMVVAALLTGLCDDEKKIVQQLINHTIRK